MIKALFLIFEPEAAWSRVVNARRSLGFVLGCYLLPMVLIVAFVQGWGLVEWGKWQSDIGLIRKFSIAEAVVYCTLQTLWLLLFIAICAHCIKELGGTFNGRHTYTQAFTAVSYGLSPLFLLRLLDVFPAMNPWITWVIGIILCITILYHGIPRVMEPDPPHAFGLYFMSSLLLLMVTGLERFITAWY